MIPSLISKVLESFLFYSYRSQRIHLLMSLLIVHSLFSLPYSVFLSLSSVLFWTDRLPNMQEIVPRSYTFWYYTPSLPTAVIFMLIFMGLTGVHSWKFTTKTWFCIAFTLGSLCMFTHFGIDLSTKPWKKAYPSFLVEIIGYIGRAIAHSNTTTMGLYILENIFILLAPTLFAASIYMTLGRVIRRVGAEHLSVIRVSRLTKTFVWGDVLSFVVQGNSPSLDSGLFSMGKSCSHWWTSDSACLIFHFLDLSPRVWETHPPRPHPRISPTRDSVEEGIVYAICCQCLDHDSLNFPHHWVCAWKQHVFFHSTKNNTTAMRGPIPKRLLNISNCPIMVKNGTKLQSLQE